LELDQPCIVLDCSKVKYISSARVEGLVQHLEVAVKRHGDIQLAAVSPDSAIILELMRVDRLVRVFPNLEEAERSFRTKVTNIRGSVSFPPPSEIEFLKEAG
jgi:anti-anti-sigma regulatory factor